MCLLTFPTLIWSVNTWGKPLLEPTPVHAHWCSVIPATFPKTKLLAVPQLEQHPSPHPQAGQVAPQWVPLVWLGSISPSQGRGWFWGFSSKDRYSCSCSSTIPQSHTLHQPLALQSHSPNGCSRLVHAGSTWSMCYPVAVWVLLSGIAAFHEHFWFARSTVLLGQGQETNPPCWEELSRRQEPLTAEAMQMWYAPLD